MPVFAQGKDPKKHIVVCEKEWRRLGYKDERVWPHLFPNTFDDLPNKWYKMEEGIGEMFTWNELKENFLKDFKFLAKEELLVEKSIKNETIEKEDPQRLTTKDFPPTFS